jgi:hypothetical protein
MISTLRSASQRASRQVGTVGGEVFGDRPCSIQTVSRAGDRWIR